MEVLVKSKTKNYGFRLVKIALCALSILLCADIADAGIIGKPSNFLTINSGLVGWWTFDGADMAPNVRDKSGQGYHASLINQNPTTTTMGKVGQALRFDGVNDYITNISSGANTSANAKNTVSFWMYWEGSSDSEVFGWGEGVSPNLDYSLWIPPSGSCFGFNTTNGEVLGISTAGLANRWVYVTAVFHNGTPSAVDNKLYIDGVEQSISFCQGVSSLSVTAGTEFWVGSYRGAAAFKGKIDDFRMYNRTLSATEIKALYNSGGSKAATTPRGITGQGLNSGLVGHWTFDGADMNPNIRDKSGQGNNGNLTNFTSTTTVLGKVGQALLFDGNNDFVQTPLTIDNDNNYSISAWFKLNDSLNCNPTGTGFCNILGSTSGAGGQGFALYVRAANLLAFSIENGYGSTGTEADYTLPVANKVWYHVVATYNTDSDTMSLYVDGVFRDSVVRSGSTGSTVQIGSYDSSYIINGQIDDMRVYNRVLSATEIKALYNSGGSKAATTPRGITGQGLNSGLLGWWTMDGKDTNWLTGRVSDLSGNGNTGIVMNLATSTAPVLGKIGQAFKFDGSNQYIDLGTKVLGYGTVSVSAWFKYVDDGICSNTYEGVISKNGYSNFVIGVSCTGGNSGKVAFYAENVAHSSSGDIYATPFVNDNQWHFAVGTCDGTTCRMYLDGNYQNQSALSGDVSDENANITIGRHAGLNRFFNGSIDDVRIYNRVLSATEIKQLYNLGR